MKSHTSYDKKNWAVLLGTICYSALFYEQSAGLNFLIFSFLYSIFFLWSEPPLLMNKVWLFYCFCTLFSSLFVFCYGNDLALLANVTALIMLSCSAVSSSSSVLINLCQYAWSLPIAPYLFLNRLRKYKLTSGNSENGTKFLIYMLSSCILIAFIALYKGANPLFDRYTKAINLDFLTLPWFFFTLGGFVLILSAYQQHRNGKLDSWETNQLEPLRINPETIFSEHIRKALVFLFIVVNIMALFINLLDLNFLYMGAGLPEGVTHKEFVHKGVNMLIISILLGISIILFAFRRALNFDSNNRVLKLMVIIWIVLNLFMVISTAVRNHMYITEALLTYKRIGVYFWLFFALAGLITTYLKLRLFKPNWYLLRINSFIAVTILTLSSAIEWDQFISDYNLRHRTMLSSLDKKYLLSLSEGNIAQLYELRNKAGFDVDSVWHYQYHYYSPGRAVLDKKMYDFITSYDHGDSRSYCIRKKRVKRQIDHLRDKGTFDSLDLSVNHPDLRHITYFTHLKELRLPDWFHFNYEEIDSLAKLKYLEILHIRNLQEHQVAKLKKLPGLKFIHVKISDPKELQLVKDSAAPIVVIN